MWISSSLAILALAWVLLIPAAALADDRGLRERARCAQLDMAIVLGEPVSEEDKKSCAVLDRAPAQAPQVRRPDVPALPPDRKQVDRRPDWVDRPPTRSGVVYGVGQGRDSQAAFAQAVAMIAAQFSTQIRSEFKSSSSENTTERYKNDKRVESKTTSSEGASSTISMVVAATLDQVMLEDQWVARSPSAIWVLASLDLAAMKEREQAMIDAVVQAVTEASERLMSRVRQDGVLDQEELERLVSSLGDVRALGKGPVPQRVKDAWDQTYRDFKDWVRRLVECVEVSGDVVPRKGRPQTLDSKARLAPGGTLRLRLACRGVPLANARMRLSAEGGLVQVARLATTDGAGNVAVSLGALFGRGVRLGMVHDFEGRPGAFWVQGLKPSNLSTMTFVPDRQATMRVEVTGGTSAENRRLQDDLEAMAVREWGVEIARSATAALKAQIRLRFDPPGRPGSQVSIPVEAALTVTPAEGGGVFLSQTIRSGALGIDEAQVRAEALVNLSRTLSRTRLPAVLDPAANIE